MRCQMAPHLEGCCVPPALSCTAPCWGGELCQVAGLLPQDGLRWEFVGTQVPGCALC